MSIILIIVLIILACWSTISLGYTLGRAKERKEMHQYMATIIDAINTNTGLIDQALRSLTQKEKS